MTRRAWLWAVLGTALAAQPAALWLDVPFVKQVENGCGSAALAMTLQYWRQHGASLDPKLADAVYIHAQLYSESLHGIAASAMQQYFEDHGFQALVFRGRWEDLGAHLAKGRPLIIAMRTGDESHYVVVAGISADTVAMNDPADRKLRKVGRAEFETKWRAAANWTLLAVPRPPS